MKHRPAGTPSRRFGNWHGAASALLVSAGLSLAWPACAQPSVPPPTLGLAQLRPDSCAFPGDLQAPVPSNRHLVAVSYKVFSDGRLSEAVVTGQSGDVAYDARLTNRLRECRFVPGLRPDEQGRTGGVLFMALGPWPISKEVASGASRQASTLKDDSCRPKPDGYPPASLRANEQGTTGLRAWLHADGRLNFIELVGSSGYPRLDWASLLTLVGCNFRAATDEAGRPKSGSLDMSMRWALE